MSYATEFLGLLKALNLIEFTLADISSHTFTCYPASVLIDIKRILKSENKYLTEEIINNKGRKKFTIIEDKIK